MPLGPWAIAKRLLCIQIVFSTSPQHHLLNGVMEKALTLKVKGPGFKSRLGSMELSQKLVTFFL